MSVSRSISDAWPGFAGESYHPGAPVTPQPERYHAGFATMWCWHGRQWIDGHEPPAPFSNHGVSGWRWADVGAEQCVCGGANRVRVGTIYLCADCRAILPDVTPDIEHEHHLRLLLADFAKRGQRIADLEAQIAARSALEARRDAYSARNYANARRLGWAGPFNSADFTNWLEGVAAALDAYHLDIGTEEGAADIVQVLGWASGNYLDAEHLRSVVRGVRDALDLDDEEDIAAVVTARLRASGPFLAKVREHVPTFERSELDLLRQVCRRPRPGKGRGLRWAHVAATLSVGSTAAQAICSALALDPDEYIGEDGDG